MKEIDKMKQSRIELAYLSRIFLKIHKVYRYRMKNITDMDDDEVIQKCHWYYEENNLKNEWESFRESIESSIIL